MTVWEATVHSVTRASFVAAVCAVVAPVVLDGVRRLGRSGLVMATMTAFCPGVLVGYAYRSWLVTQSGDLTVWAWVYAGLLWCQTLPLAVAAAALMPGEDVRLARWALRQLRVGLTSGFRLHLRAHRPRYAAALVAFLWAFQEAEVAVLLQAPGWPEWTWKQLAGGRGGWELATELWPAVAVQGAVMGMLWGLVCRETQNEPETSASVGWRSTERRTRGEPDGSPRTALVVRPSSDSADIFRRRLTPPARWLRWETFALIVMFAAVVVLPAGHIVVGTARGIAGLASQRALPGEIGVGLLVGALAATLAWWTAASHWRVPLTAFGLLGPMLVAVLTRAASTGWTLGTPGPHVAALTLSLVPKAVALWALVRIGLGADARLAATLLARSKNAAVAGPASAFFRRSFRRPAVVAAGLLAWAGYFDVMVSGVLQAPGLMTAPTRLYNLAHGGHLDLLSAMLVVTIAVPAVVLAAAVSLLVRGRV